MIVKIFFTFICYYLYLILLTIKKFKTEQTKRAVLVITTIKFTLKLIKDQIKNFVFFINRNLNLIMCVYDP